MSKLLKSVINSIVKISEEEIGALNERFVTTNYKKREEISKIGDVCREVYFIEKGMIRYYQIVDGEEITGQFFFEEGWYTDLKSFIYETPSTQGVQALEKTTILAIKKSDLNDFYDQVPKFERFGRLMAESAFIGLRTKTDKLTLLTAEERYLDLIKKRPKVIQRVPQHYIASYLGIKPQSLSRIRKRIK